MCEAPVQFQGGQCLPNPAQFGSRSVIFQCAPGPIPDSQIAPVTGGGSRPAPVTGPGGGESSAAAITVGGAVLMAGVAAAAAVQA